MTTENRESPREDPGSWLRRHRVDVRLALRVLAAALLTFALGHLLGLSQVYWAVLTAVIVMQASVGGALKATLDRFVGTLGGAVWGVAVALALPRGGVISLGIALTVALAPLAVLGAVKPAYRVASVTVIIVLLSATSRQVGPVAYAVERVYEIGLGSAVAILVALFVLPARAHSLLAQAAARVLDLFAEQIAMMPQRLLTAADPAAVRDLQDRSRRALAAVEAVAEEAARERAHRLTDAADPEPLVRNLRRLRHDLTAVTRATVEPLDELARGRLSASAAQVSRTIAAYLRGAGACFAAGKAPPPLDSVGQALSDYHAAMADLRREGRTLELPGEAVERIFGLAFALDQLRQHLDDLADRVRELSRTKEN